MLSTPLRPNPSRPSHVNSTSQANVRTTGRATFLSAVRVTPVFGDGVLPALSGHAAIMGDISNGMPDLCSWLCGTVYLGHLHVTMSITFHCSGASSWLVHRTNPVARATSAATQAICLAPLRADLCSPFGSWQAVRLGDVGFLGVIIFGQADPATRANATAVDTVNIAPSSTDMLAPSSRRHATRTPLRHQVIIRLLRLAVNTYLFTIGLTTSVEAITRTPTRAHIAHPLIRRHTVRVDHNNLGRIATPLPRRRPLHPASPVLVLDQRLHRPRLDRMRLLLRYRLPALPRRILAILTGVDNGNLLYGCEQQVDCDYGAEAGVYSSGRSERKEETLRCRCVLAPHYCDVMVVCRRVDVSATACAAVFSVGSWARRCLSWLVFCCELCDIRKSC